MIDILLGEHESYQGQGVGATDMRNSINGLSIMLAEQLTLNPLSGHLFCFCNRKRDVAKILYWDRNGFCLWHKRLEKDWFRWPEDKANVIDMEGRELSWLLEGLDLGHRTAVFHWHRVPWLYFFFLTGRN